MFEKLHQVSMISMLSSRSDSAASGRSRVLAPQKNAVFAAQDEQSMPRNSQSNRSVGDEQSRQQHQTAGTDRSEFENRLQRVSVKQQNQQAEASAQKQGQAEQAGSKATPDAEGLKKLEALVKKIGELFGFDTKAQLDLDSVSTEQLLEQFSEIIAQLHTMLQQLQQAQGPMQQIDAHMEGAAMVHKATELQAALKQMILQIKMHFSDAGLGEKLSVRLHQKGVLSGTNIAFAQPLSSQTLSKQQAEQVFAQVHTSAQVQSAGDGVSGVVEKIKKQLQQLSQQTIQKPDGASVQGQLASLKTLQMQQVSVVSHATEKAQGEKPGGSSAALLTPLQLNAKDPKAVASLFVQTMKQQGVVVVTKDNSTEMVGQMAGAKMSTFSAVQSDVSALTSAGRTMEQKVVEQIVTRFSLLAKNGGNELRINLKPEHLGEVQLKIALDGDTVVARIRVENQQVKQIVENNLQALKNALQEQNLTAGEFSVDVGSSSDDRHAQQQSFTRGASPVVRGQDGSEPVPGDTRQAESQGSDTGKRYGTNSFELIV